MPTDTERREVARRLRDMRLDPWDDAACEIAQCVGIACCNSECHGSDETPECAMALGSRLADLIEPEPERTCHDTDYSRESITCSECGEITMNTLYFVDLDGGYRTVKSHRPRFCSNCGARVIGEEAGDAD